MKKIKQKLLLRSSSLDADANKDCDANSTEVRGSTSGGSNLLGPQTKEETEPWGLKELVPGRDPILESVQVIHSCSIMSLTL